MIYKPGDRNIQSTTYVCADTGMERVQYTGGKTIDEYMADMAGQGFEVMPYEIAAPMMEAAQIAEYCKPWQEITKEQWWDALEVLPPEKWKTANGVEIFRMCEYTSGTVTEHYARLGDRYFSANRDIRTEYADIAGEILQHIENMKTEYTRADYMAGNCTHNEFYAQFVTPAILQLVKSQIGKARIKKSQDPNLDDIPIAHWDTLYSRMLFCLDRKKFKRLSSPDAPAGVMGWSLSDSICIAKEAARQIKNN